MKVGDLVTLKNLHPEWGSMALVIKIHITKWGTGQIYLIAGGSPTPQSIPWVGRDQYIAEASSESR